jgi:hypothetical protein
MNITMHLVMFISLEYFSFIEKCKFIMILSSVQRYPSKQELSMLWTGQRSGALELVYTTLHECKEKSPYPSVLKGVGVDLGNIFSSQRDSLTCSRQEQEKRITYHFAAPPG